MEQALHSTRVLWWNCLLQASITFARKGQHGLSFNVTADWSRRAGEAQHWRFTEETKICCVNINISIRYVGIAGKGAPCSLSADLSGHYWELKGPPHLWNADLLHTSDWTGQALAELNNPCFDAVFNWPCGIYKATTEQPGISSGLCCSQRGRCKSSPD